MLIKFCKNLFRISVQEQSTLVTWKLQISRFKSKRKGSFVFNLQRPHFLSEFCENMLKICVLQQSLKMQVELWGLKLKIL